MDNTARLDATAQAQLVREKQITARQLVDAAIGSIERLNPHLNAVVTACFERAREQAARPRAAGPFAGVPTLVKDLTAFEGTRLTFGSVCFRDYVAPYSHEVVRRLERAGFIVLGKTNTPEFGILPTTEPRLHVNSYPGVGLRSLRHEDQPRAEPGVPRAELAWVQRPALREPVGT